MKNRPPIQLEARGQITNINVRMEQHGDEQAAACDIFFSLHCDAKVFEMLSPDASQLEMALFDDAAAPRNQLKPLAWTVELEEQEIDIEYSRAGKKVAKTLPIASIKKFTTEPRIGGAITLRFQAQLKNTDDIVSYIHAWEHGSVKMTLFEPEQLDISLGVSQEAFEHAE